MASGTPKTIASDATAGPSAIQRGLNAVGGGGSAECSE